MDLIDLITQVSPHLYVEKLTLANECLNPFCYIQFLLSYYTYFLGNSHSFRVPTLSTVSHFHQSDIWVHRGVQCLCIGGTEASHLCPCLCDTLLLTRLCSQEVHVLLHLVLLALPFLPGEGCSKWRLLRDRPCPCLLPTPQFPLALCLPGSLAMPPVGHLPSLIIPTNYLPFPCHCHLSISCYWLIK